MGSLHNIDFGVFWASWGGSGKEPGSGPEALFRVQKVAPEVSKVSVFDGFRGVKFCSRCLDVIGSGNGFREPEVLRRFRVPEIPFPGFRKLLCT